MQHINVQSVVYDSVTGQSYLPLLLTSHDLIFYASLKKKIQKKKHSDFSLLS